MPSQRQTYSYDPSQGFPFDHDLTTIPLTEMQALVEAKPFEEPEESWDQKHARFEPLRDALESGLVLDDREVWIIEGLFWRREGLRSIASELSLSKTQVARIRDSALEKLAAHLKEPS